MKQLKKNSIFITFVLFALSCSSLAYQLDTSVDSEIKSKYNTSKLEKDVLKDKVKNIPDSDMTLPPPPKANLDYNNTTIEKPIIITKSETTSIKIPSWTKFKVKSNQTISDYSRKGSTVCFTTTEPVYTKHVMIPSGTKIYGIITNSHRPQYTGNGGLVVIQIMAINYKGQNYEVEGKITKANSKKIFLNNIKGKRQYIKGVSNKIDKGEAFYKKAKSISNKMSNNPITTILSPIPTVVGIAGYGVVTVLSPVTALTTKGGNLSIPSGSGFEIKLTKPAFVR